MDIKEIIQIYGLPEDASEEDVRTALKAGAQAIGDLAAERARAESSEDDAKSARDDKEKLEVELANEKAVRADAAIDAAVREKRIGESARETWKTRLVNEGAPAYDALANEKPLPTRDASKGLANECGSDEEANKSKQRTAMVNEIMTKENIPYFKAWTAAKERNPELFK